VTVEKLALIFSLRIIQTELTCARNNLKFSFSKETSTITNETSLFDFTSIVV